MEISFSALALPKKGSLVLAVGENLKFAPLASSLNKKIGGLLGKAAKAENFKGKRGKMISVIAPAGSTLDNIILYGAGSKRDKLTEVDIQKAGSQVYAYLNAIRAHEATVIVEEKVGNLSVSEVAAQVAHGLKLRSYNFDKYFTKKKPEEKPSLKKITFAVKDPAEAKKHYHALRSISEGVFLTRNLVSEPPNVLYPESYASICKRELQQVGVKVEILGVSEMKKLGMGALLGVGQGSEKESKMVIMQWSGAGDMKNNRPVALVGKGVTFDTGGISIKPAGGMEDMKYDMAGSAAVVGTMKALALRKAKANVVGVIGLVENMPSGGAQRPSDIVHSMSGQTIEVLNTDAEGRLVLADALWYCQDRFNPKAMVNLATLTGAITVALGSLYAGLFSNNDELSKKLTSAGDKVQEKLWRFPMGEGYDRQINSTVADMQNIGNEKGAGSITAAQFLQRFVNGTPWAHLDIAGVAWTKKDLDLIPKGATGYGVRLLNQLIEDNYEK